MANPSSPIAGVRRRLLALLGALTACALVVVPAVSASAATTITSTVTLTADGNTISASGKITSTASVTATQMAICIRQGSANFDMGYKYNIPLSTSGYAYSATRQLPAGTYTYWLCVYAGGAWYEPGGKKTLTVTDSPAQVAAQNAATLPYVTAAPRGDLPGWKQVFVDDFTTDVACGKWATSSYASRYLTYDGFSDTSGKGRYSDDIIWVGYGALSYKLQTISGTPRVAAVVPKVPSTGWGQTYGRYSVRFRADLLPGYKLSMNLWPDSDQWREGEIDLPEVDNLIAGKTIYASFHPTGATGSNTPKTSRISRSAVDGAGSMWHVATVEWSPGLVVFYLDGLEIGRDAADVPTTSFHWVLQTETTISGAKPDASVAGNVKIDWVTMYAKA